MSGGIDGLENVVAAETRLSDVDGEGGRLIIRGRLLDELVATSSFEQTIRLLWDDLFPDLPDKLERGLGRARTEVFAEVSAFDRELVKRSPVEATRAMIARIADGDTLSIALRLVAAPAVFTAAHLRLRADQAAIAPDPTASHAHDILRMCRGAAPSESEASALDTYLTTVSDHGLNASTFAARVVASTRAGLTSAVIAGLSALKGPLHGGAPGPVIDMLDDIGDAANAEAWLEAALDRGDRLMGFGHRVYRVRDPRADALKGVVHALARSSSLATGRLNLAEQVETAALAVLARRKPGRSLQTNVELYTALLLEALAFPPDAFTCVFAMGRAAGWIAHAREQLAGGRLVRPKSRYVGPAPLEEAA